MIVRGEQCSTESLKNDMKIFYYKFNPRPKCNGVTFQTRSTNFRIPNKLFFVNGTKLRRYIHLQKFLLQG